MLPKWIYPKEIKKVKYWSHLAILVLVLFIIVSVFSNLFPWFGFEVNSLGMFWEQIKTMYIPFYIVIALADIAAHSILKMN